MNRTMRILPKGATDVHHHIFDPIRFKYSPERHLTPPAATIEAYKEFKARLGIERSILVHGLSYGHDCTSLHTFIEELDVNYTGGVGVISRSTTDAELRTLNSHGVCGIRLDLYSEGAMHDLEKQKEMLIYYSKRIKDWSWSLAFLQLEPSNWEPLSKLVPSLQVPVVTDHHALLKAKSMLPAGVEVLTQPGLAPILDMLRSGNFWIKLSAPYRSSDMAPHYEDMEELVKCLVAANPRRILWGSDWPHTPRMQVRTREMALRETPFLEVDDGAWLQSLRTWLSDEAWQLLMVENPRTLYQTRQEPCRILE